MFVFDLKEDTGAIIRSNFALDVGAESFLRFRSLVQTSFECNKQISGFIKGDFILAE